MTAAAHDPTVTVVDLRTADDSGLAATGVARPQLSWRLRSDRDGVSQLAFEVETASDPDFAKALAASGIVASDRPVATLPGPALRSREVRWWRVRVRTDQGPTGWSDPARVEAALLDDADWEARPIALGIGAAATPNFRREFHLDDAPSSARLYVTALGVHDTRINGRRVALDLLEPGWTSYPSRLLYATYDVTALLRPGANAVAATVGDGWYRGTLAWGGNRDLYGDTAALLAQLEVTLSDGSRVTVATDGRWKAATGEVVAAGLYEGSTVDLRRRRERWQEPGFDDRDWGTATVLDLPAGLEQRSMPAVREVQTRSVECSPRPDGALRVDAGQNLTGHLRLVVRGRAGAEVRVRHAEVLDGDGALHTAPLRRATATDRYTLADDRPVTLEPPFTFHGFRYADIDVDPGVRLDRVEIAVVASDLMRTGRFACSDERVNRLYANTVWSQRANFLSIPTDCPQRDERLGWTGDIQVFAPTACHHFDSRSFLRSWLRDLAAEQRADGCVPHVVPNVLHVFDDESWEFGSTGWADAAVTVPWALYEAYGDTAVLTAHYDSMRRWVDWGERQLGEDGLWSTGFHFGDWLDPGAPPDRPHKATTPTAFIATAYLAHSARLTARTARILGHADAEHYASLGDRAAEAAWRAFADRAVATQTGCAMALQFAIAPASERERVAEALAELVRSTEGRIATGFLGTPLVLHALTAAGRHEEAYRLLLNEHCPGWLHQVRQGATTVWERWDAIDEHGGIHAGTMDGGEPMLSFNHYAYGAVASWLYRTVAGIGPDPEAPGYRRILFAPKPGGGMTWAAASMDTPFGTASISWTADGPSFAADIAVPPGAEGVVTPPDGGPARTVGSGRHRIESALS
jgi:alpha-L-rhamnosidase